jgi:UDP-galactopyranose mutase
MLKLPHRMKKIHVWLGKFKTEKELKKLLEDLKMSIKSFNPNLSDYDAMALAKGGVIQNLNSVELSVNYANKQGTTGTKCP